MIVYVQLDLARVIPAEPEVQLAQELQDLERYLSHITRVCFVKKSLSTSVTTLTDDCYSHNKVQYLGTISTVLMRSPSQQSETPECLFHTWDPYTHCLAHFQAAWKVESEGIDKEWCTAGPQWGRDQGCLEV